MKLNSNFLDPFLQTFSNSELFSCFIGLSNSKGDRKGENEEDEDR